MMLFPFQVKIVFLNWTHPCPKYRKFNKLRKKNWPPSNKFTKRKAKEFSLAFMAIRPIFGIRLKAFKYSPLTSQADTVR